MQLPLLDILVVARTLVAGLCVVGDRCVQMLAVRIDIDGRESSFSHYMLSGRSGHLYVYRFDVDQATLLPAATWRVKIFSGKPSKP